MKIGKFNMEIMYDMHCNKCGEYRSNIGWSTLSLSTKPTSKILKKESWRVIDSIGQVCPKCAKALSGSESEDI